MNQIARRRFMSAASLSWAMAAFVSLSSMFSSVASAQTPPAGPPPAAGDPPKPKIKLKLSFGGKKDDKDGPDEKRPRAE